MTDQQQKAIAPSFLGDDRSKNFNSFNPSHSPKFQQSGKGHPCPICDRTKDTDCRWNDEVVLCHTHIDQDAQIPGYVYRGAKDIWGQYFPTKGQQAKPVRDKAKKEFIYEDLDGTPLVKVTRIDDGQGKKKIYQSHWNGKRWIKRLTPEIKPKLRLYRINDPINQEAIAQTRPLLVVEGEGKVDLLLGLGIAATCSIGGAGKWQQYGYPNYREDLKRVNVVLCPDRDEPGLKHCLEIEQDFPKAQWLYAFPDSDQWNDLPKKDGLDIADWVAQQSLTADQILGAIEPKRPLNLKLDKLVSSKESEDTDEPDKKTIAQLLLELAEHGRYFHGSNQKAYVDIRIEGVRQTFPVRHKTFKRWLQRELYLQYGKMAGSETLNQVLGILEAKATFEGDEQEVHLRVAEYKGKVYLDLGTDDWKAIEISPEGWKVVSEYPVRFRRTENLLPLPVPEQGGSIVELKELLNLDEDGWVLAVNWLLFSFYPKYPHPILVLHGEQGTGKSYTAKLLKALLDPGKAPLIPNVADLRNLAIQSENRWVMVYDNLSHLTANQSDALCRISTGGGFSTRTLYENDEETVFEFIRPQVLTGIDELASRGDLLERSLMVKLLTIPEDERLTEAELGAKLEKLRGRILGALLTALSQTLKQLPLTKVDRLPRMADFARFAIAAETALDLPVGSFLQVYTGNRQEAHETALESSPVALAIIRLMDCRESWEGSSTDLLIELEKFVDEATLKKRTWTGTPKKLGKALTRLAPDLRGVGIDTIRPTRSSGKRLIRLERRTQQTSQMSLMSEPSEAEPDDCDVKDGDSVNPAYSNVTGDITGQQSCPDVTANVRAESSAEQRIQPVKDMSDVCDNKKVTQSNCGEWVFHKGFNTVVELLSLNHQTAKVRVPGMGTREAKVDDLEVSEGGAA